MPLAIKKEMVFGLLLLLLLVLFILNMTKKGNTGSKFGDILGDDGIRIMESAERNALDSSITYTLPGQVTINGNPVNYYKWPLLYLIDANSSPGTTPASLSGNDAYKKPPPKALLNMDYVTYGPGAAGTTGHYAASPAADSYFPNMIDLNALYSSTPLISPATGAFPAGESLNAATTGTWVLPGLSAVIKAPLVNGRKYILGVSAQLLSDYVNLFGNNKYLPTAPITHRYGNFVYVEVAYSIAGLTVVIPGAPTGTGAVTLSLQI